jgi:iron complex outermembrane receptor protein
MTRTKVVVFATSLLAAIAAPALAADHDPPAAVAGSLPAEPIPVGNEAPSSGAAQEGAALRSLARVEEITVTARKREEFLEDTPIAVTALGAAALENSNVTRIDQIQELVPNLTILSGASDQVAQIVIRGVGTSGTGISFDPGVGLYIDGVYLPRAQGSIFDVVDIQSVEVLRGPQGTLFGKNTVGGAVSVTTVKPARDAGGTISVRPGNLGQIRTRMSLDIPIRLGWFDDKLFSRISFASRNSRGYTYNAAFDQYWGEENGLAFIGSLQFLPTDRLTIDVSGSWFKDQTHIPNGECVYIQPAGLASAEYVERCALSTPRRIYTDANQIAATSSWGTWGTAAWDVGDLGPVTDVVAKSITSWRRQESPTRNDLDGSDITVIQLANLGGSDPVDGLPGTAQQIQQEFQVAASAWEDRIDLVSGLFLFWEEGDRSNGVWVPVINQRTLNRVISDNFTWALFAQGTVNPVDWLSLTAGVRYTQDDKSARQINSNLNLPPGEQQVVDVSGQESFDSWTPMASLALFAPPSWLEVAGLDHLMGYFTYSRGFKGGGLNAVLQGEPTAGLIPFLPESLDNFEIGAKLIALDQRLTLNLALFDSKYDDIQRTQLESIENPDGTIDSRQLTLNAAEAKARGIEVELQAIPIDGLLLTGMLGFLDARYDSFPNSTNPLGGAAPLDRSGERLPNAPEYNSLVSAQYSIPIALEGWLGGFLTPRIEWAYRDSEMFVGPELPQATQGSYHLINARLSYDFLGDRAQVALWGRNLADETYFTAALPLAGILGTMTRSYAPPRLWGAELTYAF